VEVELDRVSIRWCWIYCCCCCCW